MCSCIQSAWSAEVLTALLVSQLPQWLPVTIVKGGRPANLLVGTMESEWGKKLFAKALIRSIAQPVWKVKSAIAGRSATANATAPLWMLNVLASLVASRLYSVTENCTQ